ncbi:putative metal chaperone YciC [compost metagenome]
MLILNKTDRVTPQEAEEITAILRKWNAYAEILPAVRCDLEPEALLDGMGGIHAEARFQEEDEVQAAVGQAEYAGEVGETGAAVHGSHDHVMAYTHYFKRPVNSEEFEQFVKELPRDVYRAKGIVTFSDTSSRFLFQYAYREADFMKITPQGEVPDVAVFIGEHFSSLELRTRLLQLEKRILARPAVVKRSL